MRASELYKEYESPDKYPTKVHQDAQKALADAEKQGLQPSRETNPEFEIDTAQDPSLPDWAKEIESHDTSLGTIEWDKEKYKDALYVIPDQKNATVKGENLLEHLKQNNVPILNASVLDWLLAHPDQIPEEWKTKTISFWGTVYRDADGSRHVRYLRWHGSQWVDYRYWLDYDWVAGDPAAVLAS